MLGVKYTPRSLSLILLIPWMVTGVASPLNPVTASGYEEASNGRTLLSAAITLANPVLVSSSDYKLLASWDHSLPPDAAKTIKVYLVKPAGEQFGIEVPFRSCNCIFLQEEVLLKDLARYSTKLPEMLRIDPKDMLSFMLLHEIGHITHGDLGSFDKSEPDYNFDDNAQKQRESAADRFASDALVAAADPKRDASSFLSALEIETALTNASWNLSALRLIEGFGGSALCSKFLFADRGGTHPNFELRVLTVNNNLSGTPASKELLESFEACRKPTRRCLLSEMMAFNPTVGRGFPENNYAYPFDYA